MPLSMRPYALLLLGLTSAGSASGSLEEELQRCTTISSDNDRLACFDRATAALAGSSSAPANGADKTVPMVAAPSPEPKPAATAAKAKTPLDDFGFENKRELEREQEEDERLFVDIAEVKRSRANTLTIYLTNGQVWQQTDTLRFLYSRKQGRAYFVRGAMGSIYFSQENITRKIRVKRLR